MNARQKRRTCTSCSLPQLCTEFEGRKRICIPCSIIAEEGDAYKLSSYRNYRKHKETPLQRRAASRVAALKSKYGMTIEQYNFMYDQQSGKCRVRKCHREAKVVDHDHHTNAVRGLLCYRCNTGIGLFQDDPIALRSAADYLDESLRLHPWLLTAVTVPDHLKCPPGYRREVPAPVSVPQVPHIPPTDE